MSLVSVSVRNFRNITHQVFEPHERLNFLLGLNGQGKTSFLEAIGLVATFRSFRGSRVDELIQAGQTKAEIEIRLFDQGVHVDLRLELEHIQRGDKPSTQRLAWINGKPYRSSTQFLSQRFGNAVLGFHAVVFQPADHDIIRGEPAGRRAYLDRVIAAEDLEYLKTYQAYQKILDQRNSLLKSFAEGLPYDSHLLHSYTEPLVQAGARITASRLKWLTRMHEKLPNAFHQIDPKSESPGTLYLSDWMSRENDKKQPSIQGLGDRRWGYSAGQEDLPSLEILEQLFLESIQSSSQSERRQKTTVVGPHRDDWMLSYQSRSLKGYGSQGEVRTALLALKMSEIELFREKTGQRPVLLLDDFSSELDAQRRSFLLEYLKHTDLQVFVSSTEAQQGAGRRFAVSQGRLELEADL